MSGNKSNRPELIVPGSGPVSEPDGTSGPDPEPEPKPVPVSEPKLPWPIAFTTPEGVKVFYDFKGRKK